MRVDNIVLFPPDEPIDQEDEDSDHEEEDNEDGKCLNHLGPGILRAQGEIEYVDPDDRDPDVQRINQAGEVIDSVADETAPPEDAEADQQPALQVAEEAGVPGPSRKRRRKEPAPAPAVAQLNR